MTTRQLLTHSRMSSFKRCRKEHWFRYEIGLRRIEEAYALRYGRLVHEAIEILETQDAGAAVEHVRRTAPDLFDDRYTPHTLAATIRAYAEHWHNWPVVRRSVAVELSFRLPLGNPATLGISQTFERAGKIDSIAEGNDGTLALVERKTTGEDPKSERYRRRLLIDPQIGVYFNAARDLGHAVQHIIYDVIRKPTIKPYTTTPPEKRKYTKEGALYANQRLDDEPPDAWEERLHADMIGRPDHYFARHTIIRLEQDLVELRYEAWDIAKDLRQAQLHSRWYRTVGRSTCDNCPYFDLCTGLEAFEPGDGHTPVGFQYVDDVHPELGDDHAYRTTSTTVEGVEGVAANIGPA